VQLSLQDRELLGVLKQNPQKTGEELAKLAYPSQFKCRRTGVEKPPSAKANAVGRVTTKLNLYVKYGLVAATWVEVNTIGGTGKRQKFSVTDIGGQQAIVKAPKQA
jgi:hypothetical protein